MRKNSSADFRGSRSKSDMTATESAPASITETALTRVIPPIATSGLRVRARARRDLLGTLSDQCIDFPTFCARKASLLKNFHAQS